MTVEALMVQPVTLQIPSGETENSVGEVFPTYDEVPDLMYLEPKHSQEVLQDRNTPITDWIGYGRAEVEFVSTWRVVYGGHIFEVQGDPRPWFDPRTGVLSHKEIDLREVDNSDGADAGVVHVDAVAMPDAVGGVGL